MANAGCINAIGFDGTYLRTLQCLDSSNIGVGVQYTAPNPLDDKRFDYITYTDKCGCQCCLTDENEILIYATQGVIKNLTLTNDDENEAVIVKWTDLFGSNRAKTVVRYKTGSYPSSPTDGTLAVEETIQNQYQTNGYSVSGLEDGTTYYFSVFALDGDGTTINVQSMSITTEFGWQPDTTRTLFYFDFDNNLNDSSGNGNNATGSFGIGYETVGNEYVVKTTTGSKPYITLNPAVGRNIGSGDFAISLWLYPKSTSGTPMIFGTFAEQSPYYGPTIFYNHNSTNKICFRLRGTNEQFVDAVSVDTWHHLVFTRINGVCYVYVDNIKKLQFSDTSSWTSAGYTYLLSRPDSNQWFSNTGAKMDKFIYENVGRSEADVDKYYNKTKKIYNNFNLFQQVEYIQSNGTQYIDTGIANVSINTRLEYSYTPMANNNGLVFMDNGWESNGIGNGWNYYYYGSGSSSWSRYFTQNVVGVKVDMVISNTECSKNGGDTAVPGISSLAPIGTVLLFKNRRNGTIEGGASSKCHYYRRYDNGTLVQELIPCYRKSDGVIGMYDIINNNFLTNQGSGSFTKGADVN